MFLKRFSTSYCIVRQTYNASQICFAFGHCQSRLQSTATPFESFEGTNTPEDDISGPMRLYEQRLASGELRPDKNQLVVIEQLQNLSDELDGYKQQRPTNGLMSEITSRFSSLFQSPKDLQSLDVAEKYTSSPKGMYLYGGVGCGKTMLMDLFHDACSVERKKRVHFHEFMLDIHRRIHEVKVSMNLKNFNLNRSQPYDPILPVAKDVSADATLLCFDEFQVTDIADAMILKRLFSHMWRNGVVIVATSNRRPDDLYKNGLQRVNFVPFIPMLKVNCDIVNLNSVDYRRLASAIENNTYFVLGDCDAKYEMDRVYEELISREMGVEGARHLEVLGRTLTFEKTCGRILDATFAELCMKPLGAADYLEICKNFDVLLLRDVPQMSLDNRSETRRFITLVDTLYDNRVRTIISADRLPEQLFDDKTSAEYDGQARVLMSDLNIEKGDANEKASIFTGEEELFAFERAVSRITEMRTAAYWSISRQLHPR